MTARSVAMAMLVATGCAGGAGFGSVARQQDAEADGEPAERDAGSGGSVWNRPWERPVQPIDALANMCDPVAQDCAAGERCGLICYRTSPFHPIGCSAAALEGEGPDNMFACYSDSGTGGVHGEPCDSPWSCRKQHACLRGLPGSSGPTCIQFCKTDADCPDATTCIIGFGCQMGQRSYYRMCTLR